MGILNKAYAVGGLAIWWLLPLLLFLGWPGWILLTGIIGLLAVVSLRFRGHPQIISIWLPTMILAGLSTIAAVLFDGFTILACTQAQHPQSPGDAFGAVFLLFLAIPSTLGGALTSYIFYRGLKGRPKSFPQPLSTWSALNVAALILVAFFNPDFFLSGTHDNLIVQVLDTQGKSVNNVSIQYAFYDSGFNGGTKALPESSGSKTTDMMGLLHLRPNHLATLIKLKLNKDGFAESKVEIRHDDVHSGIDGFRAVHLQLTGIEEAEERWEIHNSDPLMVKVYLPTMAEIQPPVRHLQFSGSWTESHLLYLNLSTGTLNAEGPGDLKFEIMGGMTSIASKFSKNFKVTALGGAKVAVPDADGALANLPPGTTLAELQKTDPTTADLVICPPLDLESFLKMAPQHHYTDTLSMAYIGDFYYKSPDGHRYARVSLKALGNGIYSPAGGPSGDIYLGTTDSRILLYNSKAK